MILRGNVFSKTLNIDTGITIVTPSEITQKEPYKSIYLLHGLLGNHNSWVDYSMLADYASTGKSIFIMPEVARSFYSNMKHGFRYFDYVSQELPNICKSVFNISTKREDNAIMGYSMGGYGALKIALSYPEKYSFCGAFASSCLFLEPFFDKVRHNINDPAIIKMFGKPLLDDFLAIWGNDLVLKPEDNIIGLLDRIKKPQHLPKLFLTCGLEDFFFPDNKTFALKLEEKSINHEFHNWTGNHTYSFFNESLKLALEDLNW